MTFDSYRLASGYKPKSFKIIVDYRECFCPQWLMVSGASNDTFKKNNWSDSYRDIVLLFAILFFIVKCALTSVKYLIKFGIKHIWICLF